MKSAELYKTFATLLFYPGNNYPETAVRCKELLKSDYPEAAELISPFTDYILSHNEDENQELYTKTFDVQPICYLDLGYVIFGEDYKRGAFLLHMQDEQLKAENDCGTDLADNISNMLILFTKSPNREFLDELAVKILIPGVVKMISEFKQARVDLKIKVLKKLHNAIIQEELNHGNVYCNVFSALLYVLKTDFAHVEVKAELEPSIDIHYHNSFFKKDSVNTEVNQIASNYNLD